jgi:hypothetical protein
LDLTNNNGEKDEKYAMVLGTERRQKIKKGLCRNHGKIVLTLFSGCGNLYLRPAWGIHEKCDSPLEADEKFSLETGELEKWGQGDAPHMLPPPLGERGGHPHSLF